MGLPGSRWVAKECKGTTTAVEKRTGFQEGCPLFDWRRSWTLFVEGALVRFMALISRVAHGVGIILLKSLSFGLQKTYTHEIFIE